MNGNYICSSELCKELDEKHDPENLPTHTFARRSTARQMPSVFP